MIRLLLRLIGLFLLAVGFIALIRDGTRTIAGNAVSITVLGRDWSDFHDASQRSLQAAVARNIGDWLWSSVIQSILDQPTWLVFGILGAVLVLLGRKKKPLIGYARD